MKIACMMLGFNPQPLIIRSLTEFNKEDCGYPKHFFMFDFPGNDNDEIKRTAGLFGWHVHYVENKGTADNWNRAWIVASNPDILIGVEPDEIPVVGWTKEIIKPFTADDMAIVSTLQKGLHKRIYLNTYKGKFDTIGGARTVEWEIPTGWPVIAVHKRYLQFGMISNPNYGLLEQMNLEKARSLNMRCVHLLDVESIHYMHSDNFETWKTASGDKATALSYEDWLKEKQV